jgi:hypothetical protein
MKNYIFFYVVSCLCELFEGKKEIENFMLFMESKAEIYCLLLMKRCFFSSCSLRIEWENVRIEKKNCYIKKKNSLNCYKQ